VLAPYYARLREELERRFERALAFYRAVGATRYASRCEQAFADTA